MPILITTIRRYWEQARNHSPSATRMVSASLRRASRIGRMTGALLIVVAGCLSFASQASAADTCGTHGVLSAVGNVLTCTYTTSGEDTFTAPLFVTTVNVVAVGQAGGTACAFENAYSAGNGGSGARVAASLPVTQSTLFVEVPPSPGASNSPGCSAGNGVIATVGGGGGGTGIAPGGGASVVQRCSVNSSCLPTGIPQTDPRLVVAGGGGGGAVVDPSVVVGINGGNAGTGANPVCNSGQSGQGAPPGSVKGGGGSGGGCQSFSGPGAGGHGGIGPGGFTANGQSGDNGELGAGGDGGAGASHPVPVPGCGYPWPGAGGGSGFWGGGGGGGAAYCSGGAGGGGSSYAEPVATNVSMTLASSATPSVSISWVQPVNREYQFLTGRAFGLSFTQSAPNPTPVSVTYADTGPVQASLTETVSPPCQTAVNAPVGGTGTTITDVHACAEVVTSRRLSTDIEVDGRRHRQRAGIADSRPPGRESPHRDLGVEDNVCGFDWRDIRRVLVRRQRCADLPPPTYCPQHAPDRRSDQREPQ